MQGARTAMLQYILGVSFCTLVSTCHIWICEEFHSTNTSHVQMCHFWWRLWVWLYQSLWIVFSYISVYWAFLVVFYNNVYHSKNIQWQILFLVFWNETLHLCLLFSLLPTSRKCEPAGFWGKWYKAITHISDCLCSSFTFSCVVGICLGFYSLTAKTSGQLALVSCG